MELENTLVSIYCLAFNHEKYIRKTLDGFVNQITNFKFEVIVHDDASTDGTACIIREYQSKYPEIIKGIYQSENQYSRKKPILRDYILPAVRGKYVAMCEGDDYWTDNTKLQKQVDFMQSNPECLFCTHRVQEVDVNGYYTGHQFPDFHLNTGAISSEEFLRYGINYSFHTSSYLFDFEEWKSYIVNPPEYKQKCEVGDVPLMLYFANIGKIFYIDETMSCYRRGVPTSYTTSKQDVAGSHYNQIEISKRMIEVYILFDEYTRKRFHSIITEKIALYKASLCLMEKNSLSMLSSKESEYFRALSIKRKMFLILSAIFPSLSLKLFDLRRNTQKIKHKA